MTWSLALLAYVALFAIVTVAAARVLARAAQDELVEPDVGACPKFLKPDGAFLHQVALSYCGDRPEVYYVVAGNADHAIAIARILSIIDHQPSGSDPSEIRTVGCQRLPSISAIDLELEHEHTGP